MNGSFDDRTRPRARGEMAHGMKRLLTASVLIFSSGCGGGGSTQAPPAGVVCPAMAAMGSLVYPASGAIGVLDSQSVVLWQAD
jgi:hypothetical protein